MSSCCSAGHNTNTRSNSMKYCRTAPDSSKAAAARADDLRVHFKNTYEVAAAVRHMDVDDALQYLAQVLDHERCIPFRKFNGGVGRTAQAKEFKLTQGRWPEKSVKHIQSLLNNAKANAEAKGLSASQLYIYHVAVQRAVQGRRRTYRAHGRINPYMSNPCHIECILRERQEGVAKPKANGEHKVIRLTRKQLATRALPRAA